MSEQQKMSEPCPTCGEDCLVMVNEDGSMLHQSVAPVLFKANAIRMDEMSLEIERLKAEVSRRRKPDLDDCDCCGYPMDNEDPDEGYDQWFCPRCIGDAEIEHLKAELSGMTKQRDREIRIKRETRIKVHTAALEKAAKVAEDKASHLDDKGSNCEIETQQWLLEDVAAAIRTLKEQQ